MTLQQGVLLDIATIDRADLDRTKLNAACRRWQAHDYTTPAELAARIVDAEVAVTNKVVLDRAALTAASELKLICIAATGTNNVDLTAAAERNISVCNVTGYATPSVLQHVFALILAQLTRLADYGAAIADGAWQRSRSFCLLDYPIRELSGQRLGIIGYGELGRAVAHLAEAFGMSVLISERPGGPSAPGRLPLPELLAQADIVTLHCPLADNTHHLINAEALELMKPTALLINTARGPLVDEEALAHALRNGAIGGASLDVLSEEPPHASHPLLAPDIPNLILTPHTAWAARESRQRLLDEVARNIDAYNRGEARNRVA